jgi:hypothetical protein
MPPIALAVAIWTAASPQALLAAVPEATAADIPTLLIAELVETGPSGLALSGMARAHAGKRVRLVGYMARTEEPEMGGFWLAPRPVVCDEGGAGTGDLPAESVRVIVRSHPSEPPSHLDGPIAVTGTLEVGRVADGSHVSWLRLLLDEPVPSATPSDPKPQGHHPPQP